MAFPLQAIFKIVKKGKEELGERKQQAAATGLATGQLVSGALKKRQAEALAPGKEDPEQRALLEEVNARRRALETGAGAQPAVEDIGQAGVSTRTAIAKSTGGDVGGTVESFLKSQKVESEQASKAQQASQAQLPFFTSLGEKLTSNIAQRKLDLEQFERVQKQAESAQLRKEGVSNLLASAAFASDTGEVSGAGEQDDLAAMAQQGSQGQDASSVAQTPSVVTQDQVTTTQPLQEMQGTEAVAGSGRNLMDILNFGG